MSKRYVVKIGSLGVSSAEGGIDTAKIHALVRDLVALKSQGHQIVLVSSGAINSGRPHVPNPNEQWSLGWQHACAAVGMTLLLGEYQKALSKAGLVAGLMLVTHDDFRTRPRILNVRNSLLTLLHSGALPIVNENDTVSTKDITVGDNDQLAAMVAEAIDADLLVLLTEADGLFDRDPREKGAIHFPVVDFREDFATIKLSRKSSVGRGGMATKLLAVRRLTPLGQDVVIASFKFASPLSRALAGGGTLFKGDGRKKVKKRKAWIASTARPGCAIVVDQGAAKALLTHASLLPVGIKKVLGEFRRGDVVAIKFQRSTIAVGIVEYDADAVEKLKGLQTSQLQTVLKVVSSNVVIHRDNLFITSKRKTS